MGEFGEKLKTGISIEKNHIEPIRIQIDLQTNRIVIGAILSTELPDGTLTNGELVSFGSSPEDPTSFERFLDDILPNDDGVFNPRKAVMKNIRKMTKKVLAAKHGKDEADL